MSKYLSFVLFLLLTLSISSVKANIDQLSSGEREGNGLQQIFNCASDEDCDDQDPCTNEICLINGINDIRLGRCVNAGRRADCGLPDCNDNDICTVDLLNEDGSCSNIRNQVPECSPGAFVCDEFPGFRCCHFQSDCNDHNPETIDICVNMESKTGFCQYQTRIPESKPTPPEAELAPPAMTEPREDIPETAVVPTTTEPDSIFGGGCSLAFLSPTSGGSLWIFGIAVVILLIYRNRKS